MFDVTDDVGGTAYRTRSAGGTSELHVQERRIWLEPGVPAEATKLTVTIWARREIWRTLELPLWLGIALVRVAKPRGTQGVLGISRHRDSLFTTVK